jgi:hypothetical protein
VALPIDGMITRLRSDGAENASQGLLPDRVWLCVRACVRACMRARRSRYLTGHVRVGVGEHVYMCGGARDDLETATFRACDTGDVSPRHLV